MARLDTGSSGFYDEDMQEELGKAWADAILASQRLGSKPLDVATQAMFVAAGAAIDAQMTVEQFLQLARLSFKENLQIELGEN